MRLLLDTHIALWVIQNSPRLPARARSIIGDPENQSFVSVAAIWEIAIKRASGRDGYDPMPFSAQRAMRAFAESRIELLPISGAHAAAVEFLPPRHRDPFDRMMIAQAMIEPMCLVTHDRAFADYNAPIELV